MFSPYRAFYRFDALDPTGADYALSTSGGLRSLDLSIDGTLLLYTETSTRNILRLSLSTPWDLSTASVAGPLAISSSTAPGMTGTGFMTQIAPDKRTAFVGVRESNLDKVAQYNMSTDYGNPMSLFTRLQGPSGVTVIHGGAVSSDGTKLTIVSDGEFYSGTMATPWTLNTLIAWSVVELDLSGVHDNLRGFSYGRDDSQVIMTEVFSGGGLRRFHEYSLSTPADISTATLVGTYDHTGEAADNLTGVRFGNEGRNLYAIGASSIIEYEAVS